MKQQARAIDLTPTLVEQLGVKPPPGMQGSSLVPAFTGKPLPDAYSYSETLFSKLNMGWSELRAIRTDRWKYIRAPKPELYDLVKDAAETTNVLASNPAVVAEMEAKLKSIAAPAGHGPEKIETQAVDRRTMEQLKSLGYLGGGPQAALELTGKGIDPKDRVGVLKLLFDISPDSGVPASGRLELLSPWPGILECGTSRGGVEALPGRHPAGDQNSLALLSHGQPAAAARRAGRGDCCIREGVSAESIRQ
jgi:hypothetical protein